MTTNLRLILLFAVCFAFFMLAPAFLGYPFSPYPLMNWADVLDLLTPLILIPLYWLLFTDSDRANRARRMNIAFLVLASLWTMGQGMHLSANSINNLLGPGDTPVHELVHFYDEDLSHYLWHIGLVGLSVLLLIPPRLALAAAAPVPWLLVTVSALLYGFTYFAVSLEGGTILLGIPAAVVIVVALPLAARARIRTNSLTAFFFLGYLFALVLFGAWYLYWGGFPPFSELGLI